MNRRNFIKSTILASLSAPLLYSSNLKAEEFSNINFNQETYYKNSAQTIIIFLYGGASQLAGNLTNIEEIKEYSQSNYDYFRGVTKTTNNFWKEAGGDYLESLIDSNDINIFRNCFSQVREDTSNKAHGVCVSENQRGNFDTSKMGILTNLAQILYENGVINEDTNLPFITMEGDSTFFATGSKPTEPFLKPVGVNKNLENPYERGSIRNWYYYTDEEMETEDYHEKFDPALDLKMDNLAQSINKDGKIKEAFGKRRGLKEFIDNIKSSPLPEGVSYDEDNLFAEKLRTAIKILSKNSDTKVISLGSGGLGGWDDHNDAREYVKRSEKLFSALESAMKHIKLENKENEINIMVFGEFGRNVNLNSANGWDHGNLQNFYLLGGKGYFKEVGVVGETTVDNSGKINRLYLKPKGEFFEPMSIASILYSIYGIENPKELTDYPSIKNLLK